MDRLLGRSALPEPEVLQNLFLDGCRLLENENPLVRPRDSQGLPGGLVNLAPGATTVVLPDLHGRADMVRDALDLPVEAPSGGQRPLMEGLEDGWAQLVCVGDYVHSEARGYTRWLQAAQEFSGDWKEHRAMDQEMAENLTTVELLIRLKRACPDQVHLLKGNHENILNQGGGGNHPFRKFAQEGAMVLSWMQKFYPPEALTLFDRLEKNYPLLARGEHFVVTHGEPLTYYSPSEVIDYRSRGDVVAGLTWTDNDRAEWDAVARTLLAYLPDCPASLLPVYHFGGHRAVTGLYRTRAQGRFVQFHNPSLRVAAVLTPSRPIDLDQDIIAF